MKTQIFTVVLVLSQCAIVSAQGYIEAPLTPKSNQSAQSTRGPDTKLVAHYENVYERTTDHTRILIASAPESYPDPGSHFVPDRIQTKHWDAMQSYIRSHFPGARTPFAHYQSARVSVKSGDAVLKETEDWMISSADKFKTTDAKSNDDFYTMQTIILDVNTSKVIFSRAATRPHKPVGGGYIAPR